MVTLCLRVVLADWAGMEVLHLAIYLLNQLLRVNITNISSNDVLPEVIAINTAYLLVILYCHHWVDDTLQAFLNKTATAKVCSSLNESAILQGEFRFLASNLCLAILAQSLSNMNHLLVSHLPAARHILNSSLDSIIHLIRSVQTLQILSHICRPTLLSVSHITEGEGHITHTQENLVFASHVLSRFSESFSSLLRSHVQSGRYVSSFYLTRQRLVVFVGILFVCVSIIKSFISLCKSLGFVFLSFCPQTPYLFNHFLKFILNCISHKLFASTISKTLFMLDIVLNFVNQCSFQKTSCYFIMYIQVIFYCLTNTSKIQSNGIIIIRTTHLCSSLLNLHIFQFWISIKQLRVFLEQIVWFLYNIRESHSLLVHPFLRVTENNIRHFVSPLAISTTLPASSCLDSLSLLFVLLHILCHREVIHTESTLLCLVSSSRTTLASERESDIVATIDSIHSNLLSILSISTLITAHINASLLQGIHHIAWSIARNDSLLKLIKSVRSHKLCFKIEHLIVFLDCIKQLIVSIHPLIRYLNIISLLQILLFISLMVSKFNHTRNTAIIKRISVVGANTDFVRQLQELLGNLVFYLIMSLIAKRNQLILGILHGSKRINLRRVLCYEHTKF